MAVSGVDWRDVAGDMVPGVVYADRVVLSDTRERSPRMDTALITPYLYQYGVGSLIMAGSLFIAHRTGALDMQSSESRRTFGILVGGMVLYAVVHGLIQFVFPFVGV